MANGSGAAVAGLVIGIILAANAAGWGDDDGDGLALESGDSGTGEDTTTSEPAVPTSVDGGVTGPPAAEADIGSDVVWNLADHHGRAVLCLRPTDAWRHPLCFVDILSDEGITVPARAP